MEGLIFDIKHYAIHDGPGIRQTVFFKGCPLSCWWCHNPESQSTRIENYTVEKKLDGKSFTKEKSIGYHIESNDLFKVIKGDTVFYDESGGGVTFGGGEPLMQPEFLLEVASKCKEVNIHTALDTSGYTTQKTLIQILPVVDLFLFDLKIIDNKDHKKYTGVSNTLILDNLRLLNDTEQNIRIRFPVIPGITNTHKNIEEIKAYISNLNNISGIDILPYHDISRGKYQRFNKKNKMGKVKIEEDEAERIKNEFESLGYNIKIGG